LLAPLAGRATTCEWPSLINLYLSGKADQFFFFSKQLCSPPCGKVLYSALGVLPSLELFLQKAFFVLNRLLNMIVFDKSPYVQFFYLWLICSIPKRIIFGSIAVVVPRGCAVPCRFVAVCAGCRSRRQSI
ncbi:MAG: hypothetical protein AAAC47_03085, partial [Pararhizobium sp.]